MRGRFCEDSQAGRVKRPKEGKSKLRTNCRRASWRCIKKIPSLPVQPPAASPGKKREDGDDDRSIFPSAAGAAKGRCFLLQPRQSDNRAEVINDRRNAAETRRKLDPAKKDSSAVLPSRFPSQSETPRPESTRRIPAVAHGSREYLPLQEPADSRAGDAQDPICDKGRCEESKIRSESAASRSQREDDSTDVSASNDDQVGSRIPCERNTIDPLQSGLRDELNYRLMLHRLEVCESRCAGGDSAAATRNNYVADRGEAAESENR